MRGRRVGAPTRLESMSTPVQRMVVEQLLPHGVTDPRVLQVMAAVPREEFLPAALRGLAYEDRALAIGMGQTISQPLVVALMTQVLRPQHDDLALEVGTGSGYQAAVLSRLCRQVITLEIEPALAERAAATLTRLGYDNVEVVVADGSLGWPTRAPYEVILVACAAREVPSALMDEVAEGGRLVMPLDTGKGESQDLRLYERQQDEVLSRSLFPVRFVRLRTG